MPRGGRPIREVPNTDLWGIQIWASCLCSPPLIGALMHYVFSDPPYEPWTSFQIVVLVIAWFLPWIQARACFAEMKRRQLFQGPPAWVLAAGMVTFTQITFSVLFTTFIWLIA